MTGGSTNPDLAVGAARVQAPSEKNSGAVACPQNKYDEHLLETVGLLSWQTAALLSIPIMDR